MPLISGRFGERIGHPRAGSDRGRLLDSDMLRDRVRGLEPDTPEIFRETVRVLGHDFHRVLPVLLIDADGF